MINDKKVGVMQPYFLPYLGYFQLLNYVDVFVIYDNIQYTKKGWINRNNILQNASAKKISIPIKKDSDYLNVNDRKLVENSDKEKNKALNQIASSYRKAPYFEELFIIVERILKSDERNLFYFVKNSIEEVVKYMEIDTQIVISSEVESNSSLDGQERVIGLCKDVEGSLYINPQGGMELYDRNAFMKTQLELSFLFMKNIKYQQFKHEFVSNLSIIDVLMFNGVEKTKELLQQFELKKK
jgi:hypothetical protein